MGNTNLRIQNVRSKPSEGQLHTLSTIRHQVGPEKAILEAYAMAAADAIAQIIVDNEGRIDTLTDALHIVAEGFEHDKGAHMYKTPCRECVAKNALQVFYATNDDEEPERQESLFFEDEATGEYIEVKR